MSLSSLLATYASLPEHCTPTSEYLVRLSSAFHICMPTFLAFFSTALGTLSIISWLFAQLPQIYKNYQSKSASGLSIWFLIVWLLGDLLNLLGGILTKQAGWQIVVAGYFIFVDVMLDFQYFWYTYWKPPRKGALVSDCLEPGGPANGSGDGVPDGEPRPNGNLTKTTNEEDGKLDTKALDTPGKTRDSQGPPPNVSTSFSKEKEILGSLSRTVKCQGTPAFGSSPRALLLVSILCIVLTTASPLHLQIEDELHANFSSESVGYIIAWCCTCLYLGSRLPQIYKIKKRRSTDGLSSALFLAAFFGNLFYSTSIMTDPRAWESYPPYGLHGWVGPEGSDRKTHIHFAVPFWLGAAGVLLMDGIIGLQFLWFREGDVSKSVLLEDRQGRSRWQRVSGWMRGWVPSPSPSVMENVDEDEDEARGLLNRRGSHSSYGAT